MLFAVPGGLAFKISTGRASDRLHIQVRDQVEALQARVLKLAGGMASPWD
jgi:hypothetical protein